MRRVREKLDGYFGVEVDSIWRTGGLALLWKKEVDCNFKSASVHHIDDVVREGEREWKVTGFYGWPAVTDRHLSWELLRLLSGQSELPWLCVGDFNEILFSTEMKRGSRAQWQMNNFQSAVDDCGLKDVGWEGYQFTWDNGQAGEANRQKMIDRAMGKSSWFDIFPYAKLIHLTREWSDHAPIKLLFDKRVTGVEVKKNFKFEQIWIGEEGCEDAVRCGVSKGGGVLGEAIKCYARELQAWKKTSIRKIGYMIERKGKQLTQLAEGDRSEEVVRKRKKLVSEIAALRRQEEQYWRQRSRALWLHEGDRNTKFFHTRAGERKRKNYIGRLVDDSGVERAGHDEVAAVATTYFQQLFTLSQPSHFDEVLVGMEGRVQDRMNVGLRSEYNEEEVVDVLNQMHPLKATGPDGMNALFFQSFWHIIGTDVVKTVLGILRGELDPGEFNKTNIVLISKKKEPDKIRDFRPISLCNVVYKLVSKVLANRLKVFLGDIVSENQSAFTPGRLITDNVLIAFEMFHHMKNLRHVDGFMAVKLDMAKAYDRVEWRFLRRVLKIMNFDRGWIARAMACVSSVSFSVLINGVQTDEFRPE
ncbi:uncharacterized protein LOC141620760 [Silene latifolia]|uniref:uncharacterized protein LOC141620760 n=1 Tax=Silene latifolia TaxID=37657 RepID=UPI003D786C5C